MNKEKIETILKENDIVLFMKGTRLFPQCGFSANVVEILDALNIDYKEVNILADPELREDLKEYANWPTYPQLWVKGELIGGCDIIEELARRGELKKIVSRTESQA
ncbi:Grx4 family monothiol glutaredoxin [Candidatus Woesearchaeota archaeon]|nr:MAG: Grx4 family monothiol glutaredoxin [Candidatus Woesearchaeota archaeon]